MSDIQIANIHDGYSVVYFDSFIVRSDSLVANTSHPINFATNQMKYTNINMVSDRSPISIISDNSISCKKQPRLMSIRCLFRLQIESVNIPNLNLSVESNILGNDCCLDSQTPPSISVVSNISSSIYEVVISTSVFYAPNNLEDSEQLSFSLRDINMGALFSIPHIYSTVFYFMGLESDSVLPRYGLDYDMGGYNTIALSKPVVDDISSGSFLPLFAGSCSYNNSRYSMRHNITQLGDIDLEVKKIAGIRTLRIIFDITIGPITNVPSMEHKNQCIDLFCDAYLTSSMQLVAPFDVSKTVRAQFEIILSPNISHIINVKLRDVFNNQILPVQSIDKIFLSLC